MRYGLICVCEIKGEFRVDMTLGGGMLQTGILFGEEGKENKESNI